MKYRKILIRYNAYFKKAVFHSGENIKKLYFTAVKKQDFIFSQERNRKIGTTFFCFLNMVQEKQFNMA